MPSQDNIKALYETLKDTYELGSEDDFRNYLSDSNNREALRKELADDYEVGDSAAFSAYLGYDAPEKFEMPDPIHVKFQDSGTQMSDEERKAMMNNTRNMMMGANQRARRTANQMQYATANSGLQVKPINLGQNNKVVEKEPTYNPATGEVQPTYITESGNEYSSREQADLEQNIRQIERSEESVEGQLQRAYGERDRLNEMAQQRIEELEKENKERPWYQKLGEYANADKVLDAGSPAKRWDKDEQYMQIMSALRKNNELITTLEDAKNKQTNDFWHSLGTEITNGYTFSLGGKARLEDEMSRISAQKYIDSINEKRQTGEELTKEEEAAEAVLRNEAWDNEVQGKYGDQYDAWARVGKMGAVSADMMLDFLIMGGRPFSLGKQIYGAVVNGGMKLGAKLLGKAIATKALDNAATKGFGKFMLKATGATVGSLVAGAEIANSVGMGRTAADASHRYQGEVFEDSDGNLFFGHLEDDGNGGHMLIEGGNGLVSSILGAERSAISEAGSEVAGAFLPGSKYLLKGMEKIGLSKIASRFTALRGKDWYQSYSNALRTLGFNDMPEEALEEYVGTGFDALMGGDEWKNLKDLRTHVDIWLGTATISAFLNAPRIVGTGVQMAQYYRYKHNTDMADKEAANKLTEETWSPLRARIDEAKNDDVTDIVMDVLKDNKLTDDQKKAVLSYAGNLQRMRGYSLGRIAVEEETKDPVADNIDKGYTVGYETTEPSDMQDAKNSLDYQRQRAEDRFGEIKGLDDYPVQTIQTMQQQGYSPEDIQLALDYVNAKATYDGMQQRVADDVEGQVSIANSTIDRRTNRDTGMVHPITLNNDHKGYVVGGELVMSDNGIDISATKQANNDNMIFIADEEGKIQAISVDDIASADAPIDAAQEKAQAEQTIRQTYTQQAEDKMNGVLPFNVGDTYTVVDEQGQQHEVTVMQPPLAEPQGNVNVVVSVDGAEAVQMSREQIQDMYNAASLARLNQYEEEKQKAEEQAQKFPVGEQNVPKEGINGSQGGNNSEKPTYNYNDEVTLQTEQGEVKGRIVSDVNSDGQYEVEVNTPDGLRVWQMTAEEIAAMTPQQQTEEEPVEDANAMPMIGEGEDAEPDFSKATPERAYAYLFNESGLSPEEANQFIEANKKAADKELSKTQDKKKPVMGTSIAAYKKAMAEWQKAVDAAQERADYWKQLQDMREAESPASEVTSEVMPEKVLTPKQNKPARVDSNTKAWQEAKGKYGEYLNDDIDTPNDIMELVAMNMPSNINWEGRDGKRGLQAELGLKRGIGKKYDTNAFNSYLAKKGEGQSFDEAVHSIWESDNNLLPNGEHRFDDTDIRNALLDMFMNASKPSDITNYVLNNRVRMAEETLRAEQDRQEEYEEMQRLQDESMHMFGMSVEDYDAWREDVEILAPIREEYENSQEYFDNLENYSNFAGDGRRKEEENTGGIPSEGAGEVEVSRPSGQEGTRQVQGQTGNETRVPEDTAGGNAENEGRTEAGTRIVREYVKNILDQAGVDVSLADRMSDDEVHELNGLIADWEKVNDRYGRVVEEQDKNLKSKDKAVRDAAQKKIDAAQEEANEAFEPVERYVRDLQLNELSDEELVKFVADKEANAENEDALYDDADYVAALDIMEERDLGERVGENFDKTLNSLADVRDFMGKIGYKGNLSKVMTDDEGKKFVKFHANGSITPNIYLGETTKRDIYRQFHLYGNVMDINIPHSLEVEFNIEDAEGKAIRDKLYADEREEIKAFLTEAGIPFVDVIDSERGSRIIFTDKKNDNGNYTDWMDVADIEQAKEDIEYIRDKAAKEKPYTSFEELVADTDITVKDPARKQAMRQFVDKIFKHGSSNTRRERGVEYRFVYLTDATNKADRKMLEPWYSSKKIEYNDNNPTATWVDEGEQRIYFVKYQPKGVGVGDWDMTIAGYKQIEKPVGETAGTETTEPQDANLIPRDAEEEKIVADVTKKLQEDIDAAIKARNKAASDLQKARAKESDRATDLFGNDNAFNQEGQLFDNSEMPVDQSAEGVSRRTQAEQEAFNEATANLAKLQSPQERNSRIRGALDNHRRQTTFEETQQEEPQPIDTDVIRQTAANFVNETPEESAAFNARIKGMSDEELLAYMAEDGKGDINQAYHMDLYDEYDSRHNDEYLAAHDMYSQILRDNNITKEQAEEMLFNLRKDKSLYVTSERPQLLGQDDALEEYIQELDAVEGNKPTIKQVRSITEESFVLNHSEEEAEQLKYRLGESYSDYLKRNNLKATDPDALYYYYQKYGNRWDEVKELLEDVYEDPEATGFAVGEFVDSPEEGRGMLQLLDNIHVMDVLPFYDAVTDGQEEKRIAEENSKPATKNTVADREAGGALVDQLTSMGVEVDTDAETYRKTKKSAKNDNSESGKMREMRTSDGKVYGFTYRGKMYLDPQKIDAELPLHEYGHLWCEAFRKLNPEGWKKIVNTIKKDADSWKFVTSLYPDLKDENDIAEEVIAEFSGKRGAEKLLDELQRMGEKDADYKSRWGNIFKNISKAIQDFWKAVGDFLHITYKNAEQIYDQVLKDFVNKVNPRRLVEKYLSDRNKAYMQAVEDGDIAKATEIFNEALSENIGNGITPYLAVAQYLKNRTLAHAVKSRDAEAVRKVAEKIAPLIPENAVLVPAPSHTGEATDMLDVANAIAEITGAEVADVLKSKPRGSQYDAKIAGTPLSADELGITMNGELPEGKIPVVIDNVVDTGNTAEACVKALGKGIVCALGDSADKYKHVASLKSAAPVIRDRNGKVVPLDKRFDLSGSNYLGTSYQKAERTGRVSKKEAELRDALVDLMRGAGIDVSTDFEEGQAVLDAANGGEKLHKMLDNLTKASRTIKRWLKNGTRRKSFTIELPSSTLKMVRDVMGRDFDSHNITINGIVHGLKNHGVNGKKLNERSIPIREEDAELIPYIMTAPDYVTKGNTKNNRESVRFYKTLENGYVVVVEKEWDNSSDDLETITIWGELSDVSNARRTLNRTSETPTIGRSDAAKIRKDAENAIINDVKKTKLQKAYHGSGADFESFDHSHMGEGEGAQAFGWGTYVTEVEGIGRKYAQSYGKNEVLMNGKPIRDILSNADYWDSIFNLWITGAERTLDELRNNILNAYIDGRVAGPRSKRVKNFEAQKKRLLEAIERGEVTINGSDNILYEVDIPDDNGSNYLNWDGEIGSEIADGVDNALTARGIKRQEINSRGGSFIRFTTDNGIYEFRKETEGEALYEVLKRMLGSDRAASEFLHDEVGLTGIKYPAMYFSGGRSDGAKNYVIFDEKDLTITDKTKFFRTPDGQAYGFVRGGKIFLDPKIATAETPIHEYTHLWATALREANPEAWEQLKSQMIGEKDVYDYVSSLYPELKEDEDALMEEVFAFFAGKRGAERLRQEQEKAMNEAQGIFGKAEVADMFRKLRDALTKFWNMARDLFAGKNEGLKDISSKDFADMMMADLLNGVKPNATQANTRYQKNTGEEPTLMGVHNISEDKLKKAIKQGGLANPSLAVIDTKKSTHTDYGDISLIPKSGLIDSKKGRNAGTYGGDAWTPTYPTVEKQMSDKGYKAFYADMDKVTENRDLWSRLISRWDNHLEGRNDEGLAYWFLKERGEKPEDVMYESELNSEQMKRFAEVTDNGKKSFTDLDEAGRRAIIDLWAEKEGTTGDELLRKYKEVVRKVNDELLAKEETTSFRKMRIEQQNKEIDEYGIILSPVNDFMYGVKRDMERQGKMDVDTTLRKAFEKMQADGLMDEYTKWLEQKEERYGVKEVIFDGYTYDGRRKYVPNTLKNASRLMTKQGKENAYGQTGFGATRAMLLDKMRTLDDIRKQKDKIVADDERLKEVLQEASDEMYDVVHALSDMQKISDNPFSNNDYANARLQEALQVRDPIGYLNREYGYDIDRNGEFAESLKQMVEHVKNLPVKYFETKFERPVTLDEFAIAVVPEGTSQDVVDALKGAGLDVRTYAKGSSLEETTENRRKATMDAVEGRDDVLFRMGDEEEQPIFYSNAMRVVEDIKQEKATPAQWLAMIQKNGGLKMGEDKWLGLSDWLNASDKKSLTKQEVLDYIRSNQIQVEEVEYEDLFSSPVYGNWNWEGRGYRNDYDDKMYIEDVSNTAYYDDKKIGTFDNFDDAENALIEYTTNAKPINSTRIDYTTEGLENKREIALVVPTIESWNEGDQVHFGDAGYGRAVAWVRFGETMAHIYPAADVEEKRKAAEEASKAFLDFQSQMLQKYGYPMKPYRKILNEEELKENDRLAIASADAKAAYDKAKGSNLRVLVIDEIQSKRHQEGREHGYRAKYSYIRLDAARKEYKDFVERMKKEYGQGIMGNYENWPEVSESVREEIRQAKAKYYEAEKEIQRIPDAPFDKNWHELAMKRMLRYAAENGYDKVAWTTGGQQAERYNIGNVVRGIDAIPFKAGVEVGIDYDGTQVLIYTNDETLDLDVDSNGKIVKGHEAASYEYEGKQLSDVVGKEIAKKLLTGEEVKLRGEDFRIGGEGMKGFYDEILPRFMNKYGKKWGVKVGEVTLPYLEQSAKHMWAIDVTPEMKESVMQGQPLFRKKRDVNSDTYGTYEESLAASRAAGYTKKQHDAYQRRLRTRIRQAAEDVIAKLNLTGKVTLLENGESLQGRKARAKGFFNPDTGDIVIVLGNHRNVEDVVKTVLHECVAHYGLRQLFGKNFDNFLYNVLSSATPEIREQITEQARQLNWDFDTAIEEYLARLAEDTDFERAMDRGWWTKIKEAFLNMLDKLGLRGYFKGELSDNELRYILWRSYQNLSEPDRYRNPFNVAEDVAMQYKLNVGNYTHSEKPNGTVAPTEETPATKAAESKAKVVRMGHIEDFLPEIKNRKDEETIEDYVSKMPAAEAKAAYKRINAQMLDEDGLNLEEQEEKDRQEWFAKHGLEGFGEHSANRLKGLIEKYGEKMLYLRWNLQDRLDKLNVLYRDGDDFTEHVNSIPRRYGLRGGAPFLVVNGKKELDWLRDTVSPEAFALVMKAYNRPNVTGTHIFPANFAIVFGEKVSSPEEAGITWWHEQTHSFFDSLPQDKQKEYGDFFLNYMQKNYPEDYETIINEYKEPDWGSEACAYFAENIIKEQGADNFMTANFVGDEEISTFANELREYLRNGKEGKTNNRPEQGADKSDASRHGNSRGRNDQPQGRERRTAEGEGSPRASYRIGDDFSDNRDKAIVRDHYERMMQSGLYQFREAVQDSMLSLRRLMEEIDKASGGKGKIEDIASFENAYTAENAMSSASHAQQDLYGKLLFNPLLNEVKRLAKENSSRDEVTRYMMAKHGLERNRVMAEQAYKKYQEEHPYGKKTLDDFRERDYAGLTALTGEEDVAAAEAMAQQMVDDFEQAHDTKDLWDLTNACTKATLEKIYKGGLLSKDVYDNIRDMYEYYIPLRGFDEKTSDEVYGYLNHDAPAYGSVMKSAKGRSSMADDPLAVIANMADAGIMQANRNIMKQKFLKFVLNHPSDAISVSDMWLHYDDVNDEWEVITADIKENDSPDEVRRKTEAFEERMKVLAETDPEHYKRGRDAVNIPIRTINGTLNEHQVHVKMGGKDYILTVNGNPRVAQALNGLTNPDTDTNGAIGKILKSAEAVNRQMSLFYTTRNPEFVLSNFLRDAAYANSTMWVRETPNYAYKFNKNFVRVNPAVIYRLIQKYNKGTLDMNDEIERAFYDFMINGGETGYTNIQDVEKQKKLIKKYLKEGNKAVVNTQLAWEIVGEKLDEINRSVENCARFAAFLTSRQMGRSVERSVWDAKEVSVNFNKKGAGSKFLDANGQTRLGQAGAFVSGLGRSSYVFWNASIQGLTNFLRLHKHHTGKALAYDAAFFALGMVIAGYGGGDDDDYYNLPEWVRRNNICIKIPGTHSYLKLPLGIEMRAIYGMGELAASILSGKERKSDEELAMSIISQLSQTMPLDLMEGGRDLFNGKDFAWSTVSPTYVKPLFEIADNRNWMGMPIYDDSPWKEGDPEWTKAGKRTNKWLVNFSRWSNELSKEDDERRGWANWNPSKVEHVFEGMLGGYATTVSKLMKAYEMATGEMPFDWSNALFASRVLASADENVEAKRINSEYYKYYEEYKDMKKLINEYKQQQRHGALDVAEKIATLNYSPRYGHYMAIGGYVKGIDKIRSMLNKGVASPEAQQRMEKMLLELKRDAIEAVRQYDDSVKISREVKK